MSPRKKAPPTNVAQAYEQALHTAPEERYLLQLFIAGTTPRSTRALMNLKAICDTHLPGRYEIEVIDIYQQPVLAVVEQVVAAPTVLKKLPRPLRRLVGDLSNVERVLLALNVSAATGPKRSPIADAERIDDGHQPAHPSGPPAGA
jgi:circadian clock protein KaiB